MPTCQYCHKKWPYKETLKRSFTLGGGMVCPYCHHLQYYTAKYKKKSSIFSFLIISILLLANLIIGPSYLFIIALVCIIPLFIFLSPFFIELSNEEEHGF